MAGDLLSSPNPISNAVPSSPPAKSTAAVYGGGITPYAILSSVVAASGGILFGFDLGISGGVTATGSFLSKFFPDVYAEMNRENKRNYCKFNSQALTAFTSSLYISGLFSTLVASRVTEKYGRRPSMLIGGALFLAGSAMGGAAVNVYMLILSRILLGFGVGFTNQKLPKLPDIWYPCGEPNQLRHSEDQSRLGVANITFLRRHPGHLPPRRRHLPPRDTHQHNPPRRRSPSGPPCPPKDPRQLRQRGRGVRRPHRRLNRLHQTPIFPARPAKLSPTYRDGRRPPSVPSKHRHRRCELLRPGYVPHNRAERKRGAHVGGHHQGHQFDLHASGDVSVGGQNWPPSSVAYRRGGDGGGARGSRRGAEVGNAGPRNGEQGERLRGGGAGVPVRGGVRLVVGADGVAVDERDISGGDKVGGAEHSGFGDFPDGIRRGAEPACVALRIEGGTLLLVRRRRGGDDGFCLLVGAGDERRAFGEDGLLVDGPLVLEEICDL